MNTAVRVSRTTLILLLLLLLQRVVKRLDSLDNSGMHLNGDDREGGCDREEMLSKK